MARLPEDPAEIARTLVRAEVKMPEDDGCVPAQVTLQPIETE